MLDSSFYGLALDNVMGSTAVQYKAVNRQTGFTWWEEGAEFGFSFSCLSLFLLAHN